jgi:hypothetical protein
MCLPKKEKKKDYRDVGIWDDIRGGHKTHGLDDIMIFTLFFRRDMILFTIYYYTTRNSKFIIYLSSLGWFGMDCSSSNIAAASVIVPQSLLPPYSGNHRNGLPRTTHVIVKSSNSHKNSNSSTSPPEEQSSKVASTN